MWYLHLIAFVAVAAIVAVRFPTAMHEPRARISWLASVLGVGALLTLGTVVDQRILDIGNHNWLKLGQGLLMVSAFWLLMRAVLSGPSMSLRDLRWWPLAAISAVFVATFAAIRDKESTNFYFIEDNVHELDVYLYGMTHMAAITAIASWLLIGMRDRSGYWLLRLGSAAVLVACLTELIDLTLAHLGVVGEVPSFVALLFEPVFYPGVLALVVGMGILAASRHRRQRRLTRLAFELDSIASDRGLHHLPFGSPFHPGEAGPALLRRFADFRDHAMLLDFTLTERESDALEQVASILTAHHSDSDATSENRTFGGRE